jgi:hypothetical protein
LYNCIIITIFLLNNPYCTGIVCVNTKSCDHILTHLL